jgi:hypothetical protein
VSSRSSIWVAEILESEDGPVAAELTLEEILGGRSEFGPIGDPTPGPVREGEYAPLLPKTPPPPAPGPGCEYVPAAAAAGAWDGVSVLDLGDVTERDW